MAIQDENGVILRNIQEQVQKNKDDIESLKQAGMGHEPIPGPMGPIGPMGEQGVQGERGPGYYGTASMLPSPTAYVEEDMFLLNDGSLYKNVRGHWVRQASMRGPQGIQGETGAEVIANPEGESQDMLDTISIDGVRYSINSTVYFGDVEGDPNDNDLLAEYLTEIRNVAEGKCKSFVLDDEWPIPSDLDLQTGQYYGYDGTRINSIQALNSFVGLRTYANMDFANQGSTLNLTNKWILVQDNTGKFIIMMGAIGAGSAFNGAEVGDIILVKQTEVPDRWLGVGSLWHQLETAKVDLANYAALNAANTFTADQTFEGKLYVNYIRANTGNLTLISNSGSTYFNSNLYPNNPNNQSLGASTARWKDIYLAGTVYSATLVGSKLKLGNTDLSESQLQQLLALIA